MVRCPPHGPSRMITAQPSPRFCPRVADFRRTESLLADALDGLREQSRREIDGSGKGASNE